MSREIKFRAWDIHCKHMLGHSYLIDVVDGGGSIIQMILDESIECHLMQYTGLKDSNGAEIYEGDILRIYFGIPTVSAVIKVYFHDGCWMVSKSDGSQELPIFDCCQCDLEVIGNIHENPDLLK